MPSDEPISGARDRWDRLWRRFGVPAPADGTLEELLAAYGDRQRHYHTFAHVLDCLEVLDREHIFTNEALRAQHEEAARSNLETALRELTTQDSQP